MAQHQQRICRECTSRNARISAFLRADGKNFDTVPFQEVLRNAEEIMNITQGTIDLPRDAIRDVTASYNYLRRMQRSTPMTIFQINSIILDEKINEDHVERALNCVICMEQFDSSIIVKKLKCEHLFHEHCILTWLKGSVTCPICRALLNDKVFKIQDIAQGRRLLDAIFHQNRIQFLSVMLPFYDRFDQCTCDSLVLPN